MGSSPVTATTPPADRPDRLLECFLDGVVGWQRGQPLVVAFSGGADSTALLAATAAVAGRDGPVCAAHLDHRLDPGSGERARAARRIAASLGVRWVLGTADPEGDTPRGAEHWARRSRYSFLEQTRRQQGAAAVLTGHHRSDQAETVLLRLIYGSGLRGLAGIQPWVAGVGRPWLALPREALHRLAAGTGQELVDDPTNLDLSVPRNFVRHRLLPRLRARDSQIEARLAGLARAAAAARSDCERRLVDELGLGADLDLDRLETLPQSLWPFALARLRPGVEEQLFDGDGTLSGIHRSELSELGRQLRQGGRVEVTLAGGHRWVADDGRLRFKARRRPEVVAPFRLNLPLPGQVDLPIGGRLVIAEADPEPWMTVGDSYRAALEMEPGKHLQVRQRRPGDRIRPLGSNYDRKLKDVLIDAKVPRAERDRLPLLIVDGQPIWVPGVTIDERYRMQGRQPLWVAHWYPGRRN